MLDGGESVVCADRRIDVGGLARTGVQSDANEVKRIFASLPQLRIHPIHREALLRRGMRRIRGHVSFTLTASACVSCLCFKVHRHCSPATLTFT